MEQEQQKMGFWLLTALVVGNMGGSGIFMLPRTLAAVASPLGVLLAWSFTALGVLMLALVYGNLSLRKPDITGGPQIYAKELFQNKRRSLLGGFLVTWGYWVADFIGVVAMLITFTSYLSAIFPILSSKEIIWSLGSFDLYLGNFLSFLIASLLLWLITFTIWRGMETAGKVNFIATLTKVLGFLFFIVVAIYSFDASYFFPLDQPRYNDAGEVVSVFGQVNHAAISTLWAFAGIESAVVFSDRAKRKSDIRKATITGLFITTILYVGITLLVMGTMPQSQLIVSEKPLADAMYNVVGSAGSSIIAILGCIAIVGTTIGWVMISAEVPYQAAKNGMFIEKFAKENRRKAPVFSLFLSCSLSQLFLFSAISQSMAQVFDFIVFVSILTYLLPLGMGPIYQLKLVISGETYEKDKRARTIDGIISFIAAIYFTWLVLTGTSDMKGFILGICLILSAFIFYPLLKLPPKENQQRSK
ncbi:amino acid permease [Rubeoparvulum massiliense]|uniref:amino acid permease n=1 Tax=Rubeoparvulum massiliense TaxID=1631346 RepID=UPI00065E5F9E|nr:amino acid permease [Rubeoparvulum massiliense]